MLETIWPYLVGGLLLVIAALISTRRPDELEECEEQPTEILIISKESESPHDRRRNPAA